MTALPPPFRFLLGVVGGWVCVRALMLAAPSDQPPVHPAPLPGMLASAPLRPPLTAGAAGRPAGPEAPAPAPAAAPVLPIRSAAPRGGAAPPGPAFAPIRGTASPAPASVPSPDRAVAGLGGWQAPRNGRASRWSASAWLFMREGGGAGLAPGAPLGGSQAGARATYDLGSGVALSARAYAPLDDIGAAEVSVGVDWRPLREVPVRLLAERREKLASGGRSAFSLTAYGGASDVTVGPARLDLYAQAGVVGAESRDLFADGAARLGVPAGRAKIGVGAWGAAQPGAARADVGPQASLSLPAGKARLVIAADWRFRIAGDAAPGSGPALTVATEF